MQLEPRQVAVLLVAAKRAASSRRDSNLVHHAADANFKAMHLAVSYAFLIGRKAVDKGALKAATSEQDAMSAMDAAPRAVHDALLKSMPKALLLTLVDGGKAGIDALPKRLKAASNPEGINQYKGGSDKETNKALVRNAGVKVNAPSHLTDAAHEAVAHVVSDKQLASAMNGKTIEVKDLGSKHGTSGANRLYVDSKDLEKHGAGFTASAIRHELEHDILTRQGISSAQQESRVRYKTGLWSALKASSISSINPHAAEGLKKAAREQGIKVLAAPMRSLAPFNIRFDQTSPEAIAWAQEHAGELAKDLSDTTRDDIKDAIASALEGDGLSQAYDDILDAVGDEDRAAMIARTEVMDAANEGLAQSWAQATDAGLLSGNELKEWIATSDCCDDCAEVDGEQVSIDDDFSIGDDPPAHPNCRCTMGLAMAGAAE